MTVDDNFVILPVVVKAIFGSKPISFEIYVAIARLPFRTFKLGCCKHIRRVLDYKPKSVIRKSFLSISNDRH